MSAGRNLVAHAIVQTKLLHTAITRTIITPTPPRMVLRKLNTPDEVKQDAKLLHVSGKSLSAVF